MNIKNLSDLGKIAALCRKKGIESIKISENCIEFKLGDVPVKEGRRSKSQKAATEADPKFIDTKAPTEEELLYWSSAGIAEGNN